MEANRTDELTKRIAWLDLVEADLGPEREELLEETRSEGYTLAEHNEEIAELEALITVITGEVQDQTEYLNDLKDRLWAHREVIAQTDWKAAQTADLDRQIAELQAKRNALEDES